MARTIGAVIAGYLAMALFIFATFTAAYLMMGAEGSFQAGSYEISGIWIAVSIVLSVIAALLGGWLCRLIGRSPKAPVALAALVLVLGILSAFLEMKKVVPAVRLGDVNNMQAMQNAKTPAWLLFLNPVIGMAGVMAGSKLKREA
jgi:MFS family permease